jgi:hypothetical protein
MNKYKIIGCYTQWYEIEVEAEDEDEASDLALSGDADLILTDCDDWFIEDIKDITK